MQIHRIHGIDVSKFQDPSRFDWQQMRSLAQAAAEMIPNRPFFLVARATYGGKGVNALDPNFRAFAEHCRKYGITFGAYMFARQLHSAAEHLTAFNQQLATIDGLQPGDFFPMLDIENNQVNGDGPVSPTIVNTVFRDIARALYDQHGGLLIYRPSYFTDYLNKPNASDWGWMVDPEYYHWLADYSVPMGQPRIPDYLKIPDVLKPNNAPRLHQWHLHQSKPIKVPFYRSLSDKDVMDVNTYSAGTWAPPVIKSSAAPPVIPGEPPRADERERYDHAFELVHEAVEQLAAATLRLATATDVLRNIV